MMTPIFNHIRSKSTHGSPPYSASQLQAHLNLAPLIDWLNVLEA